MRSVLGLAALLAPTAPARAHTTIEGIGEFYNGLLHPAVVPAHAIVLVGLGLLLGQQGVAHLWRALPVFAAALAVALLASGQAAVPAAASWLLVAALACGLLLASAMHLPIAAGTVLALATAALVGLDSAPDLVGAERLLTLAGTWLSASFAVLWFFALADVGRRPWQQVAVRVAGSWIAAASLMVLALGLAA